MSNKNTKEVSPATYAEWYGCSPQWIRWVLKNRTFADLPHVIEVRRYSRFYTLVVPDWVTGESFETLTPKK